MAVLTPRDRDILTRYSQGHTITRIAHELHYSPDTVKDRLKVLRRDWNTRRRWS